ncbi:peptide chain release factor N(5)-glutamine methyltransferase [Virgibacillus alimentarius]|uniref:peptide chain release factor N(5)-glutamine methyltransferase n=1 Tax=Virgibacillus alimentarius TaxID=698769 RepID=UPI0004932EB8|nr:MULTISPECIES: peptide chain release factor N(5)-glutamine methyltransferase [Virgibacillus]HLR67253.1 peptide chain release factor N(5)-glutamine methyltransferase [Virgibacillus sp.]
MKASTQFEVLKWASLFLKEHHREPKIAELLLQHHMQVSRSNFYATMREPVPPVIIQKFKADIQKHARTGVPIQHLTGYESFYGHHFHVNEHVLIPRPETEEMVQHTIHVAKQHFAHNHITIVDIGTGSGAIACILALELPSATVYATDISIEALTVAQTNAEKLQAEVTFLHGDFLEPILSKHIHADIIVSNPPYIAKTEEVRLTDTVKNFDPSLALFADEEGLAAYRQIINNLPKVIKKDSTVVFEIGYDQGEVVTSLLRAVFPYVQAEIIQDINGKDRIVSAKLSG